MPAWMTWLIGIGAVVTALGILWKKVIRPGAGFISNVETMVPLMTELRDEFAESPGALKVLGKIAGQFRTDSGSSLRDVVNRLEAAAIKNEQALDLLAIQFESARQLSDRDRQQMQRLEIMLDRMTVKTEQDRKHIAKNLATAQTAVEGVAFDLAESHKRADDVIKGNPAGEAADAAAQSSKTDEEVLDDSGG